MKKQLGTVDLFFPVPASLVVCGQEEKANIITIAWIGMVSSTPPTIGIALSKSRYSLGLIRDLKEFTINIPKADHYAQVDYCGLISGKKRNKFSDLNYTPLPSKEVKVPIIKECPYNMECKMIKEIELGDYILILGEIVETHLDKDKMMSDDRIKVDMAAINPLVYCATIREYWSLGKKLGDGFGAGKRILSTLECR